VLRELQPFDDRVAMKGLDAAAVRAVVELMGRCAAWAHLRSGGRQGAAIADEWVDFGERRRMRKSLLAAALDAAADVQRDWRQYCEAYDAGQFSGA